MPAFNFKGRFVSLVESGKKRQTIRAKSRGAEAGRTAYLYTGQRTRQCRKLGQATITAVCPISFRRDQSGQECATVFEPGACQAKRLSVDDFESLAKADGFDTAAELVSWFEALYGLPFVGYLIQWGDLS